MEGGKDKNDDLIGRATNRRSYQNAMPTIEEYEIIIKRQKGTY